MIIEKPYGMHNEMDIRPDRMSILEWMRKIDQGKLILKPKSKINSREWWSDKQKSRFIESVLLNIPIPLIYVIEDEFGRYMIVDGHERTIALKRFMIDRGLKLNGLTVLKEIDGMGFDDLPDFLKVKIEDKEFFFYTIRYNTPENLVYEVYNRANMFTTS